MECSVKVRRGGVGRSRHGMIGQGWARRSRWGKE